MNVVVVTAISDIRAVVSSWDTWKGTRFITGFDNLRERPQSLKFSRLAMVIHSFLTNSAWYASPALLKPYIRYKKSVFFMFEVDLFYPSPDVIGR